MSQQLRDWRRIRIPVSALNGLHVVKISGGRPTLAAYMSCDDIPSGADFAQRAAGMVFIWARRHLIRNQLNKTRGSIKIRLQIFLTGRYRPLHNGVKPRWNVEIRRSVGLQLRSPPPWFNQYLFRVRTTCANRRTAHFAVIIPGEERRVRPPQHNARGFVVLLNTSTETQRSQIP